MHYCHLLGLFSINFYIFINPSQKLKKMQIAGCIPATVYIPLKWQGQIHVYDLMDDTSNKTNGLTHNSTAGLEIPWRFYGTDYNKGKTMANDMKRFKNKQLQQSNKMWTSDPSGAWSYLLEGSHHCVQADDYEKLVLLLHKYI